MFAASVGHHQRAGYGAFAKSGRMGSTLLRPEAQLLPNFLTLARINATMTYCDSRFEGQSEDGRRSNVDLW